MEKENKPLKPLKLVRAFKNDLPNDIVKIKDKDQLNELYRLKVLEELQEVIDSKYQDITEFVDLVQAVRAWARVNGHEPEQLAEAIMMKTATKGHFKNYAKPATNRKGNEVYYNGKQDS